jgi:hypothetical protein
LRDAMEALLGRNDQCTIDLLVLTSSEQLLFALEKYIFLFFYKTSYFNKEVNRTELSLSEFHGDSR